MNILNVVLSGIVSGIISYFSIINFSKRNFSMKNMIIYFFLILIPSTPYLFCSSLE